MTKNAVLDRKPVFSPDGTAILFASGRDGTKSYITPEFNIERGSLNMQGFHWNFLLHGSRGCLLFL